VHCVSERFTDEQLSTALEALSDPGRFRAIEQRVARAAPQLQQVLASALAEGGWFDSAHAQRLAEVAAIDDPQERLNHFRTLLAEEARVAMMVGVAVGWELARELRPPANDD
jgi:Lon protease-like protein